MRPGCITRVRFEGGIVATSGERIGAGAGPRVACGVPAVRPPWVS